MTRLTNAHSAFYAMQLAFLKRSALTMFSTTKMRHSDTMILSATMSGALKMLF